MAFFIAKDLMFAGLCRVPLDEGAGLNPDEIAHWHTWLPFYQLFDLTPKDVNSGFRNNSKML